MNFDYVQIEVTTRCNGTCRYCIHPRVYGSAGKDMTLEVFECILNKVKQSTPRVHLQGLGEPLTHPLLSTFLIKSKSHGLQTSLTTNLLVFDPQSLRSVDFLYVSWNELRGLCISQGCGSAEMTCRNVEQIRSLPLKPRVILTCVLSAGLDSGLERLLGFAAANLDIIHGVLLSPEFTSEEQSEVSLRLLTRRVRMYANSHRSLTMHHAAITMRPTPSCGWLTNKLYLDVDGFVRPCCVQCLPTDQRFGNLLTATLEGVLANRSLCLTRDKIKAGPWDGICQRCHSLGIPGLWASTDGHGPL
jgi:MoaA/NifB/PqqE/SkfB family radical SAM enzyme